jgi:hypothetical protein
MAHPAQASHTWQLPSVGWARERELLPGREDANAVIGKRARWPQGERRLAQVGPIGERRHLRIGQGIGADNDGQRIASQRLRGKHVDLAKYEFGHLLQPPQVGALSNR